MFTKKELYQLLLFAVITSLISLAVLIFFDQRLKSNTKAKEPDTVNLIKEVQADPINETLSSYSSDGSVYLAVKKEQQTTGATVYTFSTATATEPNQQKIIYQKITSTNTYFVFPYNCWSPDNQYFFVQEISGSDKKSYLLFKNTGEDLGEGVAMINISQLFTQQLPDYTLTEITGWADPQLLIVNSKTKTGDTGASFWFDIFSHSFIQLATYFN